MSFLGQAAYHVVHNPLRFLRTLGHSDGFPQTFLAPRGRDALTRAVADLRPMPVIAQADPAAPQVAYLTGRDFWPVTAFAYASLARVAPDLARPIFLSDGTLDESTAINLQSLFPGCRVLAESEIAARLESNLPRSRFPALRRCRDELPIARKLFDLHAGQSGWKLYIDSDTAFFRRPEFLYTWRNRPGNLTMQDAGDVYGYPAPVLAEILGRPIRPCVNAGFVGLRSDHLDFDLLEHWTNRLMEAGGVNWFTEQCLTAMLMTHYGGAVAPPADYLILPDSAESRAPRAVFHHYAGASRSYLYTHAWRHTRRALAAV